MRPSGGLRHDAVDELTTDHEATLQRHQAQRRAPADRGDATAHRWSEELATMADALGVAAGDLRRPGRTDTVEAAPPPGG